MSPVIPQPEKQERSCASVHSMLGYLCEKPEGHRGRHLNGGTRWCDSSDFSAPINFAHCPEHGLHGCRTRCFECGVEVEQVPMIGLAEHEQAMAALRQELALKDEALSVVVPERDELAAELAKAREITDEMVQRAQTRHNECASAERPVGHHVSAWMRAALEAALGQETDGPSPSARVSDSHQTSAAHDALAYLADPDNWLGDPLDQTSTLHGHFTPFELARRALGQEGDGQ